MIHFFFFSSVFIPVNNFCIFSVNNAFQDQPQLRETERHVQDVLLYVLQADNDIEIIFYLQTYNYQYFSIITVLLTNTTGEKNGLKFYAGKLNSFNWRVKILIVD